MKVIALMVTLVLVAGVSVFRNRQEQAKAPALSERQASAILASTVQIAMFEHATEVGGSEAGSQGLGTVVAYGGERLILTHDHWGHLTPDLNEVEMRDAQGQLLLTLDAAACMALMVYRDGGTMVLRAPAELERLAASAPGAPAGEGDVVWFARRDAASGRATVEVAAATVTDVDGFGVPAGMRLRNLDGSAVIPGDSGGGVWAGGRLLGNLWAAGVKERQALWATLFGESGEPSDLTIVALQPLDLLSTGGITRLNGGPEKADRDVE